MNAIEISGLSKSFKGMYAVKNLNLTVPVGSIYAILGENGCGKSTTMKLICGHLVKNSGSIKLFDRDYTDAAVRGKVGALIENAGCFPNSSVYMNLKMQALNLNLENQDEQINKVLEIVRMSEHRNLKFKKCSLGMKQRVGIAMALLGDPKLLILDEPINDLDIDGVRIMREILLKLSSKGITVLISSHILAELEKIATHYGIIRNGKMIKEMSASELEAECPTYVELSTDDNEYSKTVLSSKFNKVVIVEDKIRVYDNINADKVVKYLFENNICVIEVISKKISLEEYYINLMGGNKHE